MEQQEWERVVSSFDDSTAGDELRGIGGVGLAFYESAKFGPYVVVNASPEVVSGLSDSPINIISKETFEQLLEA